MINFTKYFFQGVKNTLRVQNGVQFAYKGPWQTVTPNTIIDEWYVGDFMAAEYTVVVDVGNTRKEIIKCLVVAGPENANLTIYGRTNLSENLVDITATVNASKMQLVANPASSPDGSTYDNSTLLLGSKMIFSATYYHTINDLTTTTSTLITPPTPTPTPTPPTPTPTPPTPTPTPPTPTPTPTYAATPAAGSVNEGSALTINVVTTNVDNGTTLYWTVTNAGDFTTTSGSFTINSNAGSFTVTPAADATTEGAETFIVSIRTGSISGTVVATTSSITINDTSTTPAGTVYIVTVAPGSGNRYYIAGFVGPGPTLNLIEGNTYIFRQSDPSNATHPLRFSTTADGTWGAGVEYTTGVTIVGTAGQLGAYTQITVPVSAPTLYYYCVNHSGMGGTANTPSAATPTYDNVSSPASANEGSTVTFTVNTQNVDNGTTVGYTITGIGAGDLSSGSLTGNITITSNTGTVSVTLANDLTTEGAETMTLTLAATDSEGTSTGALSSATTINDTSTTPIVPTYAVAPAAGSVNEGSSLTFNVTTTDVADATTLYWTVTNSGDFGTSSGSFTITSNSGSFGVTPTADTTTEGAETFTASVRTGSVSGTVVATSSSVTINDTSTTPIVPTYAVTPATSSVNEGSSLTFNVATTDVADATTLYWTVTNAGDFATSSGSFTITSNAGSFSVTPTADTTTEGAETFTASVRTGSVSGTVVATSSSVTINDTSTTPAFVPDYTITVTNSGNNYLLTGSDRNGSFTSASQPALAFNNGDKVRFNVNASTSSNHPFFIKTAQSTGTGNQVAGVTGQGTTQLDWTTATVGTGTYGYQCSVHLGMWNTITIS